MENGSYTSSFLCAAVSVLLVKGCVMLYSLRVGQLEEGICRFTEVGKKLMCASVSE